MKRTLIVVAMHDGLSTMYLKTASRFGSIDGVIDLPLRYDMTLQEYSEQFLSIVNKTNNIFSINRSYVWSLCSYINKSYAAL